METVALKCWIIREVGDVAVTMEEKVDGEPSGQLVEFERALLPGDVRPGDEFRVVAQVARAQREAEQGEDFFTPVFAEATEALRAARGGGA